MKKLPNWQADLFEFINANKAKGFAWGNWDCCLATNAAIKAMTGRDLIPKELSWSDKKTALKSISTYGNTLLACMDKACSIQGIEELALPYLGVGDFAVFEQNGREIVGICDGTNLLGVGDNGWQTEPNDAAVKAWRIKRGNG
jgi:hypothetical protein